MNIAPHILAHGNWLSVEQFMEIALYAPEGGYYSTHIPGIGYRGDFSTSATLSDLPARRLVAEWRAACTACGRTLPFVEIGGGNGDMVSAVARALGFWGRMRASYYMVERSAALRRLQHLVGGNFVRIYPTMEEALRHCGGRAFIFCNELPDAFPARQFVFRSGAWRELGLSVEGGRIVWSTRDTPLPASCVFARWAQEGQVVEVAESYHRWWVSWQPLWLGGRMVTIDYGDVNERLYYRRPAGSLRGYKAHQLLQAEELPALAGHCDITTDINFSDLMQLIDGCPGDRRQFMTQRDFLLPLADPAKPEEAHLIAEPGAGDHFKVLIHHRFELP